MDIKTFNVQYSITAISTNNNNIFSAIYYNGSQKANSISSNHLHNNSTTCIKKSILIQLNTNDEVQLRIANGSSIVIEKNNILIEKMNELIIVKEVDVKTEVEVELINSNNFDEESIKYNNSNESDNLDDDETVKYNNSNESDEFDDVIESTHLEKNKECNIYYAICKEKNTFKFSVRHLV